MTEVLTRKEVSALLKIPLSTIDYFVRTGQIPFFRAGKRLVRFEKHRIERFIQDRQNIEYRHKSRS